MYTVIFEMGSSKICDNTSVGMLVQKDGKLLLVERKKIPFGFAPPAGHVDGDISYEESAQRELKEETGLTTASIAKLAEGRKNNHCSRINGSWHYWKIYKIQATGRIKRSREETKGGSGWYAIAKIKDLAKRTEQYMDGKISEKKWRASPGIEPVWYDWLKELNII